LKENPQGPLREFISTPNLRNLERKPPRTFKRVYLHPLPPNLKRKPPRTFKRAYLHPVAYCRQLAQLHDA